MMIISFSNNSIIVELNAEQAASLQQINETWPKLIEEYLNMLIKNRSRQLERIEVTTEIRNRKELKLNKEK